MTDINVVDVMLYVDKNLDASVREAVERAARS